MQKILIRDIHSTKVVDLNKIICIIADGRCSIFYIMDKENKKPNEKEYFCIISSRNIGDFLNEIKNTRLMRVHRKAIVHLDKIEEIYNDHTLKLCIDIDTTIKVADDYYQDFKSRLVN